MTNAEFTRLLETVNHDIHENVDPDDFEWEDSPEIEKRIRRQEDCTTIFGAKRLTQEFKDAILALGEAGAQHPCEQQYIEFRAWYWEQALRTRLERK